jgi:hypothetical protein
MDDADFLKLLASGVVGALLTALGAWTNHIFSTRKWEAERRAAEVGQMREMADLLLMAAIKMAEQKQLKTATQMPQDLAEFFRRLREEADSLHGLHQSLDEHIRRAPEPLVDHVRFMVDRIRRAERTTPFDQKLASLAVVHFRKALDEYVRRGATSGLHLIPGESPPD